MDVAWPERYLTFSGVRCWDLVRRIYADVAGIKLPAHAEIAIADLPAVADALAAGRKGGLWRQVSAGAEQPLDVVLIRDLVRGELVPAHVGIVTQVGYLIHVTADLVPAHLPFRDAPNLRADRWLRNRIDSVHRHEALA